MASEFELDYVWVHDQLEKMQASESVKSAVKSLADSMNALGLATQDAVKSLEVLAELAKGHSLLPEETEEAWMDVIPGLVHTGDVVRVKKDAFIGDMAQKHNGRVGMVLFVRSGDISVRMTDGLSPNLDGARYRAEHLEYRVV